MQEEENFREIIANILREIRCSIQEIRARCYTHAQKNSGKFLGWPKTLFSFFSMMTSSSTELSLSSKTILLDYCDSYHISLHFLKILSKVVNFCIAILILRMEETSNIFSIL